MDEVLDMMPEDIRNQIQLDRSAEGANEVKMELDYKNDTMTIVSKEVRIMGVNTPTLTTRGATIRDLRITLKGDGGLPLIGKASKTSVDIQFSKAVAERITAHTKNGDISATSVELGRTTMNLSGEGSDLPTGQDSAARFYVSNAVIDGFKSADGTAEQVRVDALNGGLNQQDGTGFVEAGSIAASGASSKGNTIGETSISGARVDMRQGENGTEHTVAVSSASVGDVSTASGDKIAGASLSDLSADYGNGDLALAAKSLDVNGVSGKTGLDSASVSDLSVSGSGLGGESWNTNVGMGGASLKGLQAGNIRLGSASASDMNLSAQNTVDGVTASGSVGNAKASGLNANNVSMGSAFVRDGDFDLSRTADGTAHVGVNATRADVNQLQVNDTSVQAIGVDHFSTVQRGKNDASYQAGRLRASGVNAEGTTVASVDSRGVDVDSRNGGVTAGMKSLSVGEVRSGEHSMSGAELSGAKFASSKDSMSGSLESGSVSGVRTNIGGKELSANDISMQQAAFERKGETMTGSLSSLSVGGASYDGSTVKSASVSGVQGTHGPTTSAGSVDNVAISGVRSGDHSLDAFSASGLSGERNGEQMAGRVAKVRADGLRSGDNAITSVNAKGLTVGKNGDVLSGGVDGLDASGISTAMGTVRNASVVGASGTHGPDKSTVSVNAASAAGVDMGQHGAGAVWVSGVKGERDGKGMSGSVESMRGVQLRSGGTSVGEVNASGLSGGHDGKSTQLGMSSLDATQIAHRGDGLSADVNSVGVRGASANIGPDGLSGGASEVSARGISGRAIKSGEKSGPNPDVIRALGGAVQDADIRASVPMNSGKYGEGFGRLKVKDGTQMDASMQIRDGNLVPGAVKADFSTNLGGPAWVGVRGAYLDQDSSLRADLAGAPDINLGKSLGLGKNMDTSLASHANAAADRIAAGRSNTPEPKPGGLKDSFDMANANLSADVRMRNGNVDLGSGNSVALAGENETDNVVSVNKAGQEDLVMTFTRFLTSSLRMGAGGSSVQADAAAIEQGQVSIDKTAEEGTAIEGSIGAITLKNVGVNK